MVPGHEIIGRVNRRGAGSDPLQQGDHVGVGCMVDSCLECDACEDGLEAILPLRATYTYNALDRDGAPTYGGYSDRIVVKERFVVKSLTGWISRPRRRFSARDHHMSPLRPLERRRGQQGGRRRPRRPRHMAIKLAKALGAHVTLFTRSPGKRKTPGALARTRSCSPPTSRKWQA